MFRKSLAALAVAMASTGVQAAGGLNLNIAADRMTANLPVLGKLVTANGPSLPVLGALPSVDLDVLEGPYAPGISKILQPVIGMGVGSLQVYIVPVVHAIDERIPLPVLGDALGGD